MLACAPGAGHQSITGGFLPVTIRVLLATWRVCQSGPLGAGEFRAWLGLLEMVARRHRMAAGMVPSYSCAELAKILGVTERRARTAVRRLVDAGLVAWGETAIAFLGPQAALDLGPVADSIGRGEGTLALPRRLVRFLARGARSSLMAVALGVLLRCLSRRKVGFDGRGRVKASWIARAFGVAERAVKAARAELIELGWIAPELSGQAAENRWGRAYRIDLAWGVPGCRRAGCGSTPPPVESGCGSTPPLLDPDPLLGEEKNQEPAIGGPTGISLEKPGGGDEPSILAAIPQPTLSPPTFPTISPVAPPVLSPPPSSVPIQTPPSGPATRSVLPLPRLADIRSEDLRDIGRTLELHAQAVGRGLMTSSEGDRLKFCTAAEHAAAVGTVNPGGLFARLVHQGWWHLATQADEDAASRRLKQHLHDNAAGGVARHIVGARPTSPGRATPSADAVLVREVGAAVARTGSRADPFPLVQAKDPSWTRERWDRALLELSRDDRPRPASFPTLGSALAMTSGHSFLPGRPNPGRPRSSTGEMEVTLVRRNR